MSLKYTLEQWEFNNKIRLRCAEREREYADLVKEESNLLCELSNERCKNNKADVDHCLEEKSKTIECFRKELLLVRKELILEIDSLSIYKRRIENALASVEKNALAICEDCIRARDGRLGIDLVRDEVDDELFKERTTILNGKLNLKVILGRTEEELRRLKSTLYHIDRDLKDKDCNLSIDRYNLSLKESYSICLKETKIVPSRISLKEWERQCDKNITTAREQLNKIKPSRFDIDKTIKRITDSLNKQKQVTDDAFVRRIDETKLMKTKLEQQHYEVMKKSNEIKSTIEDIDKCIKDKENYLALAYVRFENRKKRPGLELTKDDVEIHLADEIQRLLNIVSDLRDLLDKSQGSLRSLLKTQIQIEEDINVKTNSLKIDQVDCTIRRQSMDYHAF